MIDLTLKRNPLKTQILSAVQEVTGISDEWLLEVTARTGSHTWACTDLVNETWVASDRTPIDETNLYLSIDFAFDCIRCFLTVTKENVSRTVKGLVELRDRIPNFGDGWTFVDFYAGVGLSTIYFAKLLEDAGIDAKVIYHNSPSPKIQIGLAEHFIREAGSPKNLEFQITDDVPAGDCYMFYEVLEHFRQPWSIVSDIIDKNNPHVIVHASSFNLPDCAGHFEIYDIKDRLYSGPEASKHFDRCFASAGYIGVNSSHCWDNAPNWQLRSNYVPIHELAKNGRWDLKAQSLNVRRDALIQNKCNVFMHDFKMTLNDCMQSSVIDDKDWALIKQTTFDQLVTLAKDKYLLKGSGF